MLRIHRCLGAEKTTRGFEVTRARPATKRKLVNARANTTPSQSEQAAASWESAPIDAKHRALRSIHPMEDTFEKGAICRFKLHLVRKWILLPFDRTNRKRRIIAFLSPEDKKIMSEVRDTIS